MELLLNNPPKCRNTRTEVHNIIFLKDIENNYENVKINIFYNMGVLKRLGCSQLEFSYPFHLTAQTCKSEFSRFRIWGA